MNLLKIISIFLFIACQNTFGQSATTDSLKDYVGTYKMKEGAPFESFFVKASEGYLFGEADGNGSNKLLKQKEPETFLSTSSYGSTIIFVRDSTNKITGLKLLIQGTELLADKIE